MKHFISTHEVRRNRLRRLRREGGILAILTSERGAVDLAAFLFSSLVISFISGLITASVVAVIPRARDEAAKGILASVRAAQDVWRAQTGRRYATLDELTSGPAPLLQEGAPVTITLNRDGTGYVAQVVSRLRRTYTITNDCPTPVAS